MTDLTYLTTIANDELISLKALINQKTTVTTELWEKLGASGFYFSLLAFRDDPSETDVVEMIAAYNDFIQLCKATPDSDSDMLLFLSTAYVNLCLAMDDEVYSLSERLQSLLAASEAKVFAIALPPLNATFDRVGMKKAMLSAAGSKGMKSRYRPFEEMRQYVQEYASKVTNKKEHAAVTEIVRAMPLRLYEASKNPERIVKETLRIVRSATIKPDKF
jgi:hypothetical protein